jgi:IclR family transcriptional regulator, KDG regulon repressor
MKSLHKVIDILEIFAECGPLGIRDLAARTGFPPATVHRIVTTLMKRGYLQQNNVAKSYHLSTKFMVLADRVQDQFDLIPIARPYLERMSLETKENANLCVWDGYEVVYIDHVHSRDHILQSFTRLGARAPLHATGVGKVFLSHLSESDLLEYFDRQELIPFTAATITDKNRLEAEVRLIRKAGYAVDNEEKENGVRCVAAPILNHKNEIVAAISVSGSSQRIDEARIPAIGQIVLECGRGISNMLGWNEAV